MDTTQPARRAEGAPETPGDRPATAEKSAFYRTFWRKVDAALGVVRSGRDLTSILDDVITILLSEFRQELRIVAGRLYEKVDEHRYVLRRWRGDHPRDKLGYAVPITYTAVQLLLERGTLIMKETDPGFDPAIEDPLGVSLFAAMVIGEDNRWLLSFSIEGEVDRERMLYMLTAVQHVVGLKIRQRRIHDILEEARRIQLSMLPKGPPAFPPFDIQGRSVPAESVSGDLFDYLPISDRTLGLAVADASGHGLPAALQARDVITGLRMGMAENLKIVSTIEKLNTVISRSTLATRFVSLFYGELETTGNFIYCSAGHPPGLLYHQERFTPLDLGGLVLGPDPAARYERGYSRVEPGDTVVLYTDGITEAFDPAGHSFGVERLEVLIAESHPLPARALVDRIFEAVETFSQRTSPLDDQTVVVVRRPAPH